MMHLKSRYVDIYRTEILFYTDGGADYPKSIKKFKELPDHQKNRIFLHCSTEESNATTL